MLFLIQKRQAREPYNPYTEQLMPYSWGTVFASANIDMSRTWLRALNNRERRVYDDPVY